MDGNEIQLKIKDQIKDNKILIYMKGSPYAPQCGFSARTVQALIECEAEFSYVDVLSNPDVRQYLPKVSDWPTFPQLFIAGELIGGCDIVTQLHANGELKKLIDSSI
ncbi:MAG: Grx4 family monothiol glutaredoxin [Gammaproteobacteria bacterium]